MSTTTCVSIFNNSRAFQTYNCSFWEEGDRALLECMRQEPVWILNTAEVWICCPVKVLAKADAAAEWEKLSDKEQALYVAMAQSK